MASEIKTRPTNVSVHEYRQTVSKDLAEGAALLTKLGKYTEGAGCVYVKKLEDIDLGVLRQLIAIAWSRNDDPVPA